MRVGEIYRKTPVGDEGEIYRKTPVGDEGGI